MSIARPNIEAPSLTGQFQLAKIQVARAESTLRASKEAFRVAKRRRKEAKAAARRAKKEVKRAKTNLGEAKEALAVVSAKVAEAGRKRLRQRVRTSAVPLKQGASARLGRSGGRIRKRIGLQAPSGNASPAPPGAGPQPGSLARETATPSDGRTPAETAAAESL